MSERVFGFPGSATVLVLASGAARERLVDSLLTAARAGEPDIVPLPAEFDARKYELGEQLYGSLGNARDDAVGRRDAVQFNWRFFTAPMAGIVSVNRELRHVDSLGAGMFLQTFLLGLTAMRPWLSLTGRAVWDCKWPFYVRICNSATFLRG